MVLDVLGGFGWCWCWIRCNVIDGVFFCVYGNLLFSDVFGEGEENWDFGICNIFVV